MIPEMANARIEELSPEELIALPYELMDGIRVLEQTPTAIAGFEGGDRETQRSGKDRRASSSRQDDLRR